MAVTAIATAAVGRKMAAGSPVRERNPTVAIHRPTAGIVAANVASGIYRTSTGSRATPVGDGLVQGACFRRRGAKKAREGNGSDEEKSLEHDIWDPGYGPFDVRGKDSMQGKSSFSAPLPQECSGPGLPQASGRPRLPPNSARTASRGSAGVLPWTGAHHAGRRYRQSPSLAWRVWSGSFA